MTSDFVSSNQSMNQQSAIAHRKALGLRRALMINHRPKRSAMRQLRSLSRVLVAVVGCCLWRAGASEECSFSTTLDELGAGTHVVSVVVSNTFDGVPPADATCTSGYGGVLFELSAEAGDIRALFIDVAANYGYLETLDDYGPTLISAGTTTYIGTVTLGSNEVDLVDGLSQTEANGGFDMGIAIGSAECTTSDKVRYVSIRVVGCGFTVEHVAFQRLGVVTTCMGDSTVTDDVDERHTYGYGRALPSDCDADEVVEASAERASNLEGTTIEVTTLDSTTDGTVGGKQSSSSSPASSPSSSSFATSSSGVGSFSGGGDRDSADTCGALSHVLQSDENSLVIEMTESDPLSYAASTDDCIYRTVTVIFEAWNGSSIKAAFFDLENDLDDLDVHAEVMSPSDGSVTVSSEKVYQNSLSSIDGYDSGSGGFDFAVAFDGDSSYIRVELTACGLSVNSFAAHRATVVVMYESEQYNLSSFYLECVFRDAATPAPSAVVTVAPSASPTQSTGSPAFSPSSPPASSMSLAPTAAPTIRTTAAPTLTISAERGSSITGTLKVSGLDPDISDDEVYDNARDGLAQAFGVDAATAVTVAAPGLLPAYSDDDYITDDQSRRRQRRRRRLSAAQSDERPHRKRRWFSSSDELVSASSEWPVADAREGVISLEDEGQGKRRPDGSEQYLPDPGKSGGSPSHSGAASGERVRSPQPRYFLRSGVRSSDFARELQTDGAGDNDDSLGTVGTNTNTMNVSFSVLLPDEGQGSGSYSSTQGRTPSQRVAAAVEAYVEGGGRAVLADALGVSASNVSMADLQYCAGAGSCNSTTAVVTQSQSVGEELGTSGPWERFMEDMGGVLILSLFGTCCVSICFWAICYRILFHGTDELDRSDGVKPVGARRHADRTAGVGQGRSASGKSDVSRSPTSLPGTTVDRAGPAPDVGGTLPTSTGRGDGKESEGVAAGMEAANGSGSGGSAGSGHWTSSHFGRMHSLDEYHAQNPLRSSEADSAGSRSSVSQKSSSNRNRFSLVSTKSYKDDFALESVGYDGEREGAFRTTNPMFLGRDVASPSAVSPSPEGSPAAITESSSSPAADNALQSVVAQASSVAIGRRGALGAFSGPGVSGTTSITGGSRSPLRSSQNQMESPIAMLSERTSSDSTGDENADATKATDDSPGGRFEPLASVAAGISSSGSLGDTEDSGSGVAGGGERGRGRAAAGAASGAGSAYGGRMSPSPAKKRGGEGVGGVGYGLQTLYSELRDVSPSLSPGITSASDTESVGERTMGEVDKDEEGRADEAVEKTELEQMSAVGDDTDTVTGSSLWAVRPGDSSPRFEESGNIEGKASDVVGGASATLELDQHVSEVEQQQARSSASMSPRVEGRRPRDEAARRSGPGGASVEIRTTRSESPSAGRRRGGGGLSVLRNTWQGLMSGRSSSRGGSRGQGTTGVRPMRSESAPIRTRSPGSPSPAGDANLRTRRHQSATARWSYPEAESPTVSGAESTRGEGHGTDATRSVSSSSTSTGRLAADVLSHPPTVSAESDFSISDVFAGQGGALSPAGLAAAAAASSAADLFQSTGGTPSSTSVTPRARIASGHRLGPKPAPTAVVRSPRSASPRAGSPRAPGRVLSAVAAAAAETAAEEERKLKRAEMGRADEAGSSTATATSASPQHAGEQEGSERDRRAQEETEMAALVGVGATPLSSDPPPVGTDSAPPPVEEDPAEESPLTMRGTALPARLATPQALVSPTTPPPGGEPTFQAADPTRGGGGATVSPGRTTIGRAGEHEHDIGSSGRSGLALSPGAVMLSPGTDSDRGSSPSPTGDVGGDLRRAHGIVRFGTELGEKDEDDEGDAPPDALRLSPWITTRQAEVREQEQRDVAGAPRRISGDSTGIGPGESVDSSAEISPEASGPRAVSFSPESAASSVALAGIGAGGVSAATGARTSVSMGGIGAAEARGGLLAARAGSRRALGALDLMQVVGTFSDSESPTDSVRAATPSPASTTPTHVRSPRATAAAVTAATGGILSPTRPAFLSDDTGERPASPIMFVPFDAPSPLPPIETDPISLHLSSGATPLSGLTGLGGLPTFAAVDSPGVESTREYSESDEEAPDTTGDLLGERLIP